VEFYVDLQGIVLGKNSDNNIDVAPSKHNFHVNIIWAAKE